MKINCEIEIDHFNEDISVDEMFMNQVKKQVADTIYKKVQDVVAHEVAVNLAEKLDTFITSILNGFMDRRIVITDKWGDKQSEYENINEMLKEKFDNFIEQKVSKDGKPVKDGCGYGESYTRIHYLLDERVGKKVKEITEMIVKEVDTKIKASLQTEVKSQISNSLLQHIDLASILKK
jgi:hypothetical protein